MPQVYQTTVWQARLPDGWIVRELYFDGATLFKPDGVGQISILVCPSESQPPKYNPDINAHFSGKLRGFTSTPAGHGTFTRLWWLYCGGRTLMVSYSCALSNAEAERKEVDEILQSMAESDRQAA